MGSRSGCSRCTGSGACSRSCERDGSSRFRLGYGTRTFQVARYARSGWWAGGPQGEAGVGVLGEVASLSGFGLRAQSGGGPVIPDFGTGSKCETENHLFCWGWVQDHWGDTLQPALLEHLKLTLIAVAIGFAIAFVSALVAYRYRRLDQPIGL